MSAHRCRADVTKIRPRLSRMFAVGLSDDCVLFTCADTGRSIVVFFGHPRVAVVEKRAGEMRMAATIDGGCRRAGGPEQMGRDVYSDRFTSKL